MGEDFRKMIISGFGFRVDRNKRWLERGVRKEGD
jgi:hypothetical protein